MNLVNVYHKHPNVSGINVIFEHLPLSRNRAAQCNAQFLFLQTLTVVSFQQTKRVCTDILVISACVDTSCERIDQLKKVLLDK